MRTKEDLAEELETLRDDCRRFAMQLEDHERALSRLLQQLKQLEVNNVTRLALDRLCDQAEREKDNNS